MISTAFLGLALQPSSIPSPGLAQRSCPRITRDRRPALLFIEGAPEGNRLWVAHNEAGELRREPVISAKYLEVAQLDNTVFLIGTPESPPLGRTYAMDLESGTMRLLSDTTTLRCLRSEPARGMAMLIFSDGLRGEVQLIELGLGSMATAVRQVLSRARLGDEYDRMMVGSIKISPDFTHIAYMNKKGQNTVERQSTFELTLLNLDTLDARVLDCNVRVEIPDISSFAYGVPPLEWISSGQVLYQHMIDESGEGAQANGTLDLRLDGRCVFKIVDIRTADISERFRTKVRMELNGGSLAVDPLTGRLLLNHKYMLDHVQKSLVDRILPFVATMDRARRRTEIRSPVRVLYDGNSLCTNTCLSASGRHFAYSLGHDPESLAAEIYAVFDVDAEPVRVAAGIHSPTIPIGWIE
jgi:hypothetical protein